VRHLAKTILSRSKDRRRVELELGVEASCESIHRATVGVVCGIGDELVVERNLCRVGGGIAVISLDDLFEPVVGQCAVSDQDSQATGSTAVVAAAGSNPIFRFKAQLSQNQKIPRQ
jgi:hypothetical protein